MKTRIRQLDIGKFIVESFQSGHAGMEYRELDTPPENISAERKWVAEEKFCSLEEANEYAKKLSSFNKEIVLAAFENGDKI